VAVDSVVGVAAATVVEAGEETAAAAVGGGETAAVEGGGRTVRVTAETSPDRQMRNAAINPRSHAVTAFFVTFDEFFVMGTVFCWRCKLS
jgi:hypothetical protein